MRKTAAVLALLLFAVPAGVQSLGLGDIEVFSALNEPLSARIPLRSANPGALDDLSVGLASREQFARTGLDRPFVLSKLKFALVPNDSGSGHIQITTREPIAEPFLNFLVEVEWPLGTVVREYTLLLDPPVYGAAMASAVEEAMRTVDAPVAPQQPTAADSATMQSAPVEQTPGPAVQPAQPPEPAPIAEPAVVSEPEPVLAPEPAPIPETPAAPRVVTMTLAEALGLSEAIYASPAPSTATQLSSPSEVIGLPSYGPVTANDTLWSLANSLRPNSSLSIQQTMLAILKKNPDAFASNNVNSLMAGAILQIPTREEIEAVTATEALAEVKRQYAQWDEYRQAVATDVPSTPQGAAAQAADIETPVEADVTDSEFTLQDYLGEERAEAEVETAELNETQTVETQTEAGADSSRLELLSAGSATEGEGVSVGEQARLEQLNQELDLTLEQVDTQRRENEELSSRLSEVESLVADLERLVALKDDSIAALQAQLAEREAEIAAQATVLEQAQAERFESERIRETGEAPPTTLDEEAPPSVDETMAAGPEEAPLTTVEEDAPFDEDAAFEALERDLAAALDDEGLAEPLAETDAEMQVEPVQDPAQAESETEELVEEPVALTEEAITEEAITEEAVTEEAVTEAAVPEEAVAEAPDTTATMSETVAETAPVAPPRAASREPKSLLDKALDMVLSNMLYVGGGLVGLLVLVVGLVLTRMKRQQSEAEDQDAAVLADDALVGGLAEEDALAVPEAAAVTSEEEPPALEEEPAVAEMAAEDDDEQEEDPLEGVNIYLAYERYDEAADMVRGVIKSHPDKPEYRLRLVEIFYAARNVASFEIAARELQDAVGAESPFMEKARAWWSEMSPGQTLFEQSEAQPSSDAPGGGGMFDVTEVDHTLSSDDMTMEILLDDSSETGEDTGSVDFDLGLDDTSDTGEGDLSGETNIDFEIGEVDDQEGEDHAATALDFTLEEVAPEASEDVAPATTAEYDTVSQAGPDESQTVPIPRADASSEEDDSIEFDLDFTVEPDEPKDKDTGTEEQTIDFAIDLDETTGPGEGELGDETGLTLVLDPGDEPAAVDDEMQTLAGEGSDEDAVIDFTLDAEDKAVAETQLEEPAPESAGAEDRTQFMIRDVPSAQSVEESLDFTLDTNADLTEDLDFNLEPDMGGLEPAEGDVAADHAAASGEDVQSSEFETVKLNVNELESVGVFKPEDTTLTQLQEDSLEVDSEFVDVFDDTGETADRTSVDDVTAEFVDDVFDVGEEHPDSAAAEDLEEMTQEQTEATQFMLRDIEAMSADSALDNEEQRRTLVLGRQPTGEIDEMQTKLDLAQAYIDMGDTDGARGILGEVIAEGSDTQKQQAGELLAKLG